MYNPNYAERAIPLVSVNDKTGSTFYLIIQSTK